ncbi:uncharacterized protein LOC143619459 [Bidens hawaiensis]|uniref:uncharacterized protein LOC143619459 n=1 Tax=Bidens hawaiensis TaxID=980011 RepID=UPI00404A670F
MVKSYAIHARRDLYIKKNDPLRFRVICLGTNPNLVVGEGPNVSSQEKLKAIPKKHDCLRSRTIGLYTMSTIAKEIEVELQTTPNLSAKELKAKFQQMHQVQPSESKMRRAKTIALQRKDGDHTKQYTYLRSYIDELLKANPGKYPGQILTVVGMDGNNCLYPVAFAIVEAECIDSWKWFLYLLGDDLDLPHDANFTFISDRQKDLFKQLRVFSLGQSIGFVVDTSMRT